MPTESALVIIYKKVGKQIHLKIRNFKLEQGL